ncbi:MAG TPA: HAMP domain-containing protein, partial [Gemmatimonadaceae bacterium]|nr:HAMP domain-containing protein [Gemmatimonadaceae bacterium]
MTAPSINRDLTPSSATRSLPLERKLPLLIFGILAIVLASSLGLSYYEVRRAAELSVAERVSSLAAQLAALVQQTMTARISALRRAANDPVVVAALETPDRAPDRNVFEALRVLRTPADSATPPRLLTRDGRTLGDVQLERATDTRQVRDEVQSFGESRDSARISRLYASGGHASYWITVPVRRDGQLLGFVAQERRVSGNPRSVQPFRDLLGSDIELYVRNADGPLWVDLTGAVIPTPSIASHFNEKVDVYSHGARGESLASSAPIKGTPILVTLESPMRSVLARPLATMRTLAAIALVLALVGAGLAWLIGRQLTRPLVELTTAAEAITQGDYSERVAAGGSDEIGRLATAFNRMTERVQVSSEASAQAVDRLTKTATRQQFLAEASQILAGSLSDQTLLAGLARLCVPELADYCTIHVA